MTEKVEEEGNEEESAWVSSSAPGDLRVPLPAAWWVVPLKDSAARTRSIRALVERQVGLFVDPVGSSPGGVTGWV